jgi:predicted deacylase
VIGSTVRGVPIPAYTVGAPGRVPDPGRPQVVAIAAIHGCEVISSELALAMLRSITDDTVESRPLSEVADLTIVPAVNLDARADALHSLTRRGLFVSAPRSNANGVDLNRNFPKPEGVTDNWLPLSGTTWRSPWYRGPSPLSEPEAAALDALVDELRPAGLVNLHSTGCIVTHPWGSRPEPPADQEGFTAMIEAFTAAQASVRYRSKQSAAWYPLIGSSNDHFYDRYGTLAITVETSPPAGSVKADWRRARRFFWYANPTDPDWWIDNDRPACFAALRAAVDHRHPGT